MLAGVGGRTISEAKARLGWAEFHAWAAYRAKHGPLHLQAHIELAAATVAYTVSGTVPRAKGKKGPEFSDFLPKRAVAAESANDASEQAPIDLDTAMATWR